eukprot:12078434-Alexandrium_andersonii.AAC.1
MLRSALPSSPMLSGALSRALRSSPELSEALSGALRSGALQGAITERGGDDVKLTAALTVASL